MLGLLIPRVCLRLVGWSSASLTELCSYWRSVSRTSRDPSRYSSNQLTTRGRAGGAVLWMLTTPPLTGVERIVGRLRGGQLPHWDGGIPAGGAVWLHRVQVSRGSTVKKESVEQTAVKQWILIFVCLGARVQRECLVFSPHLPSDASELCIRGVSYLGHQMDWLLRKDEVCVIVREQPGGGAAAQDCDLQVVLKASGSKFPLKPGNDKHRKGRAASSCLIHRNQIFMFTQLY